MLLLHNIKFYLILTVALLLYGLLKDLYNSITLFIYLEIILLWMLVSYAFIGKGLSLFGSVFALEILALAAIKAAIGLSIIVSWVRYTGTLSLLEKL